MKVGVKTHKIHTINPACQENKQQKTVKEQKAFNHKKSSSYSPSQKNNQTNKQTNQAKNKPWTIKVKRDNLLNLCEKWLKTHKRLKERFLIRQNRTKRAKSLFFKLRTTIQQKTVKPTYLLSVWCHEAGERKKPQKFSHFVLFHLIKKHSFNLLCVLDLFFRTLAVNSVSDFSGWQVQACQCQGSQWHVICMFLTY